MTTRLVVALSLVLAVPCGAQVVQLPADSVVDLNSGYGNHLSIRGIFEQNANTVLNEMPLAIYQGGSLSRALRQRSLDALNTDRNVIGYFLEGQVTWRGPACFSRLPGWRPLVQVAHHDVSAMRFTRDQYELAFFGNAGFEDREASLAPSGYTQIRYQTLGAGIQHDSTGSFIRLDLVRGNSFVQADIVAASLFTAIDGRELRTAIRGDYYASDTAGSGLEHTNGLGMAIAGGWRGQVKLFDRQFKLGARVDDLGFVRWNGNTVRIHKDTLFSYSGWEVDNLFALDAVLVNEDVLLDTFGLRYQRGEITRPLPFHVGFSTTTTIRGHWQLGLNLDYRYLLGYVPQIGVSGSRRIGTRTQLGITATCGGFGGWRAGIAVKQRIGKHVLIDLSTPHLPGLFLGRTRGAGVLFGTTVAF